MTSTIKKVVNRLDYPLYQIKHISDHDIAVVFEPQTIITEDIFEELSGTITNRCPSCKLHMDISSIHGMDYRCIDLKDFFNEQSLILYFKECTISEKYIKLIKHVTQDIEFIAKTKGKGV